MGLKPERTVCTLAAGWPRAGCGPPSQAQALVSTGTQQGRRLLGPFPCLADVCCSRLGGRLAGWPPPWSHLPRRGGGAAVSQQCQVSAPQGGPGHSPEQPSSSRALVLGLYPHLWNWPAGPPKMTEQWKRDVRRALQGGAEAEPRPGPRRLTVPGPKGGPGCFDHPSTPGSRGSSCQVLGAG